MVPQKALGEFKGRMKIFHGTEDEELRRILYASFLALQSACGKFSWDNERGKELVFERSRYVYNDYLEFFNENFVSELVSFGMDLGIMGADAQPPESSRVGGNMGLKVIG